MMYDEDFSYLRDVSRRSDFFGPIKYIPLREGRDDWYMSLGGEVKLRFEDWNNPGWGENGEHDSFLLQRYMVHGDFHLGPPVRVFLQLRSAFKNGGSPPEAIDQDKLDLHQGFLDLHLTDEDRPLLAVRAGRQELIYGSTRLVSVREGANIRRAFDGIKTMFRTKNWSVDGWITRPVALGDGYFDDTTAYDRAFWGFYSTYSWEELKGNGLDLYYLGYSKENSRYYQRKADELRHTLGARPWGRYGGWDYDLEVAYQFGEFGSGKIRAWMAATNPGYTFRSAPLEPRLGLKVEVASGDRDPKGPTLQTFNSLFHNSQLYNETDLVGLSNVILVQPNLTISPAKNLRLVFDWIFFWRESDQDAVYNNVLQIQRAPNGSSASYTGSALSGVARWQVDRHLTLYLAYTHFFTGEFVEQSGPSKDLDFLGIWARYLF